MWASVLSGAIALAYTVAGLFFLKFWVKTRDRLFAIFALAFWVLTLERVVLICLTEVKEFHPYIYLIRLFAFLLIISAVIDKNRKSSR